jgi:uncharacterized membrane protein
MPYNIWCGGCHSMIAKGVRFNAEKKQVGNYYSTKVQISIVCICSLDAITIFFYMVVNHMEQWSGMTH